MLIPAKAFIKFSSGVVLNLIFFLYFYPPASTDLTCRRMNLSRNWGRNFTLPLRMHKASTGWISASAVNECDWHYFHEREFSCAELSLKAASWVTVEGQSRNLQSVETHAEERHRCGADEAFNASVSSNVYKAKTQNYTVSQKSICDREMCFILADLLWINLWSVSYQLCRVFSKCRKQRFPLLKFLHFAFHRMSVLKRVDHGSEAH